MPRADLKVATTGMLPPSRMRVGGWPKPFFIAFMARWMALPSLGTRTGTVELWATTSNFTVPGQRWRSALSNAATIFAGFWLGTRRMETLAEAVEGIIVLAPLPW